MGRDRELGNLAVTDRLVGASWVDHAEIRHTDDTPIELRDEGGGLVGPGIGPVLATVAIVRRDLSRVEHPVTLGFEADMPDGAVDDRLRDRFGIGRRLERSDLDHDGRLHRPHGG